MPDGFSTPGHYFYTIVAVGGGHEVGYVWFFVHPSRSELFLFHILIHPSERRKGYGQAALAEIDQKAKELGCAPIGSILLCRKPGFV